MAQPVRKRKRRTRQKPEAWYPAFLATLSQTGVVKLAAAQAGITRQTAYAARDRDEQFRAEWDAAYEESMDVLEAEARRRAVVGVESSKLILYKGDPVPDFTKPGQWVDDQGKPWREGQSQGRKRWSGAFLIEKKIEYSDTLLIFLLKGGRPYKYAERRMDVPFDLTAEAEKLSEETGRPVDECVIELRKWLDDHGMTRRSG